MLTRPSRRSNARGGGFLDSAAIIRVGWCSTERQRITLGYGSEVLPWGTVVWAGFRRGRLGGVEVRCRRGGLAAYRLSCGVSAGRLV